MTPIEKDIPVTGMIVMTPKWVFLEKFEALTSEIKRVVDLYYANNSDELHGEHLRALDEIASIRREVINVFMLMWLWFEQKMSKRWYTNPADYAIVLEWNNLIVSGDANEKTFTISPTGQYTIGKE